MTASSDTKFPIFVLPMSINNDVGKEIVLTIDEKAPQIDAETIKKGVGTWMLFFVGLEGWEMGLGEWLGGARSLRTGVREHLGSSDNGFWCSGGEAPPHIVGGMKAAYEQLPRALFKQAFHMRFVSFFIDRSPPWLA